MKEKDPLGAAIAQKQEADAAAKAFADRQKAIADRQERRVTSLADLDPSEVGLAAFSALRGYAAEALGNVRAKELFMSVDRDQDGAVDAKELAAVLKV